MDKPALVILAAGMGSRYGGLKQMDAFGPCGETIIDYSIYDALNAGFGKIVFIIRDHFRLEFERVFRAKLEGKVELCFVTQELDKIPADSSYNPDREKPWGTAHAVQVAQEVVNSPFAIINADDYYGQSAYKSLYSFLTNPENQKENNYCIIGYYLQNTLSEHGTVNRGVCMADEEGNLTDIVETLKIGWEADGQISYPTDEGKSYLEKNTPVSMNMFGFMPTYFDFTEDKFKKFLAESGQELKSEFYIPQVLDDMQKEKFAKVKLIPSDSDWFGVTYQEDKPFVIEKLNTLIKEGRYPVDLWA